MKKLFLGLSTIFLLTACQQSTPTEIENPTSITQKVISLPLTLTQEPAVTPSSTPTSTSVPIVTSMPTATKAAPTQTPSPVPSSTPTPIIVMSQPITPRDITMVDESNGWAVESYNRLIRTTDGGLTWIDVSPKDVANTYFGGFFLLNAQSAWVYRSYVTEPSINLAHTIDGGKTWSIVARSLPFYPSVSINFLNEKDGTAEIYDVAAGSGWVTLYETHDGGANWSKIMLYPPLEPPEVFTGTLGLCNICGDAFYYDPKRMIITYGGLDMDPVNEVHLSVSTDLSKTWKDLHLPLPSSKYADGMVIPQMLFFYNDKDGYLPFGIVKYKSDGSYEYAVQAVYSTHDGGLSWISNPAVVENVQYRAMNQHNVDFISPTDAFVACGNDLCVTHDGARTWQIVPSSLNFAYVEGKEYVGWFDFISPTTGWAITSSPDGSVSVFWRTTDGGKTWKEFTPQLTGK